MRVAIGIGLVLSLCSGSAAAQTREFSRTVDLDAGGALRVVGSRGSMRITSWDQPKVEIRARIVRPEDVEDDYATRAVDATRIEVTGDRKAVSVSSDYSQVPTRKGWGDGDHQRVPAVHYEVRAPRRVNLSLDSDRGPVTVSGFEGVLDIVVDRGELELREVAGDVRVDIDRGDRSRISGMRGSLRLEADRTDLDIDAQALDRDSRLQIDRGEVELRVPDAQRLTVRTDISRRGRFHSDFPIQWTSSSRRRSHGHINGGGTELFVESDRANIELRRRRD